MSTTPSKSDPPTDVIVGTLAQEQVVTRLSEALRAAEHDLAGNVDHVHNLLTEARDRLAALTLARDASRLSRSAQPAARLQVSTLQTERGEPVDAFLLIPFGEVPVERPVSGDSFAFTPAHAESARRWFEQLGRKLAIDYEHQSFEHLNRRADGLRPAAGWIGGLEVRDDGLWAVDVAWTDRARELLRAGEYRYFSPVIYWTDEDQRDIAALGPVALTNDPAMHGVRPLAAQRAAEPDDGAPPAAQRLSAPTDATERALVHAEREIAVLRQRLADQQAAAFVEGGLRAGKILASTQADWRADFLRDPEATTARLRRAPVLLPPGRLMSARAQHGSPLHSSPTFQTALVGASTVESADLVAFEQALAAGRVTGTGPLADQGLTDAG